MSLHVRHVLQGRAGFTFFELLVTVCAMGGFCVCLGLPAILHFREEARRGACRAHLRQVVDVMSSSQSAMSMPAVAAALGGTAGLRVLRCPSDPLPRSAAKGGSYVSLAPHAPGAASRLAWVCRDRDFARGYRGAVSCHVDGYNESYADGRVLWKPVFAVPQRTAPW